MAVVLVTGGSSGIGLALVKRLAAAGDQVFSASRNPGRAGDIEGVTTMTVDVSDPDAAAPAIDAVVERAGRIDAVVNNAGAGVIGSIEDTSDDDALHTFQTNVLGALRLARAALPVMRRQRSGRIVNVTSMNDTFPAPFGAYYSASKAALTSASHVLDCEVRSFGIKVTVVAPGLFLTPLAESLATFSAPSGSAYAKVLDAMIALQPARLAMARDPDVVALAVEDVLRADDPPFRVVVGADAKAMDKLVRDGTPQQLADMLRAFVAGLG
jgi:NAD(P)-dependent dehydrogenase (short-subunit alcohol dehydrogenase family)